ncbi:LCP family protein [Microbacterium sp. A94]|uniref:LCP family protein n=1 Tax=Microbacterium sp. A94 TaxID=3450717 RepID=UPI003F42EDA7
MSEKIRRRRTVARHGQLRSPGPVAQLLKMLGVGLTVVLVSALSIGAFVVTDLSNTVSANAVELEGQEAAPPNISEYEGGFDLLLVGTDSCEVEYAHLFGDRCAGPDSEGNLNDVNILLHVSEEPRRLTAVSFPRDLMLPIPSCTTESGGTTSAMSKQPLNSAYMYGGLNCVAKTITELTGQDIEFAASVTFGGVIEITDAIGGVDVCLATPIKDHHTGLDLPAGIHTVQGIQALQFLRTRHGVGDGSDLGRIGNQQQYMSSLARKLISDEVLGNVPTMLRLANTALTNLEASTSLTNPMTIAQIGLAVKDVPFEDIVFLQYPTFGDPADVNKVVSNTADAQLMWDAINANQQLQVTHVNTDNEGVIVEEPAAPVDPEAVPDPSVYALPDAIKGNSAAQATCSNGNVR